MLFQLKPEAHYMGEIIDGFLQESQQQTIRPFALSLVQRHPCFDIWKDALWLLELAAWTQP